MQTMGAKTTAVLTLIYNWKPIICQIWGLLFWIPPTTTACQQPYTYTS